MRNCDPNNYFSGLVLTIRTRLTGETEKQFWHFFAKTHIRFIQELCSNYTFIFIESFTWKQIFRITIYISCGPCPRGCNVPQCFEF